MGHRGKVSKGKLQMYEPGAFAAHVSGLEGEVEVTVKRWSPARSGNQNRYYWGVVIPIIEEATGYDGEELHEALKVKFIQPWASKAGDLTIYPSTARLDTAGFSEFIEKVRRWAASFLNIHIPGPNEAPIDIEGVRI
jgi:hypothetical protein